MVGWHHQHNGRGFGWTLSIGDGQGGLAYRGSQPPGAVHGVPTSRTQLSL